VETLIALERSLGRWAAYADYCLNLPVDTPRCQPFWSFVWATFALACLALIILAAVRIVWRRRRKGPPSPSEQAPGGGAADSGARRRYR
jgi:hypothetical protein